MKSEAGIDWKEMFSLKNKIESYIFFYMDTGLWQKLKFVATIYFKLCIYYISSSEFNN